MPSWITDAALNTPGILAVGAVAYLILTGRLRTQSQIQEIREDRDTWRAAWQASEEARRAQDQAYGTLLIESARSLEGLMRAVQDVGALPRHQAGDPS